MNKKIAVVYIVTIGFIGGLVWLNISKKMENFKLTREVFNFRKILRKRSKLKEW
jgi:3-methyladenine DNA glycosylase Tag